MSSIGAVTGQGVYSKLTYKERKFKCSQWTLEAMDAVSTAAFLKAAGMVRLMGGSEKAVANREVALARSFALGSFGFNAIMEDDGLDNDPELLATFLYKLLVPHDATVSLALAIEMVKEDKPAVVAAVRNANPQKTALEDKTGQNGQTNPEPSNENGNPSQTHGETSEAS